MLLPGLLGPDHRLPDSPLHPPIPGRPTTLGNLGPLWAFHHLIVIHTWGWTLRLNPARHHDRHQPRLPYPPRP